MELKYAVLIHCVTQVVKKNLTDTRRLEVHVNHKIKQKVKL